jgi:putative Ca2+/H+ antiporter (TMEM165/GDT1 family)
MDALLVSTAVVAVAEIGDKTMLLALLLAARYREPWAIVAGIAVATLANHALAGWAGAWLATLLSPAVLQWAVVASLVAVAAWTLVPDRLDAGDAPKPSRAGAFLATTLAFFLIEIGDKTQVATVLLAAQYSPLWAVVLGSTLGLLLANGPVVLLGHRYADRLPLAAARWVAAGLFLALAAWVALRGLPA